MIKTAFPLSSTGSAVATITSSPEIHIDPKGNTWFVKQDKRLEQAGQLFFLSTLGMPVPEPVVIDESHIALPYSGVPLNEVFAKAPDASEQTCRESGILLAKLHKLFEDSDAGIDPDVLTARISASDSTAKPANNFVYRFLDRKSSSTNAIYGDSQRELVPLRRSLLELVSLVIEKGIPDDLLGSNELAFGDYKPENILLQPERLYLIDPILHFGHRVSDVAKFCVRSELEPDIKDLHVASFLLAYSRSGQVAQPDNLVWFRILDTANIVSSYLGRLAKGDRRYRLVERLAYSTSYQNQVLRLVNKALEQTEEV